MVGFRTVLCILVFSLLIYFDLCRAATKAKCLVPLHYRFGTFSQLSRLKKEKRNLVLQVLLASHPMKTDN